MENKEMIKLKNKRHSYAVYMIRNLRKSYEINQYRLSHAKKSLQKCLIDPSSNKNWIKYHKIDILDYRRELKRTADNIRKWKEIINQSQRSYAKGEFCNLCVYCEKYSSDSFYFCKAKNVLMKDSSQPCLNGKFERKLKK